MPDGSSSTAWIPEQGCSPLSERAEQEAKRAEQEARTRRELEVEVQRLREELRRRADS